MTFNAYETLGVGRQAAQEIIDAQYRAMSAAFHPDKHMSAAPHIREHFSAKQADLNKAREILSDPRKRAAHDMDLDEQSTKQTASGAGSSTVDKIIGGIGAAAAFAEKAGITDALKDRFSVKSSPNSGGAGPMIRVDEDTALPLLEAVQLIFKPTIRIGPEQDDYATVFEALQDLCDIVYDADVESEDDAPRGRKGAAKPKAKKNEKKRGR